MNLNKTNFIIANYNGLINFKKTFYQSIQQKKLKLNSIKY